MMRRLCLVLVSCLACTPDAQAPRVPVIVDAAPPADDMAPPPDDAASPKPAARTAPLRFFIGQNTPDLSAFRAEVLDVDPTFPEPDGVTLYTNIAPGACSGTTDGACDINGTINDFERTLAEYPDAALAVGLYLSDSAAGCRNQPLRALLERPDPDLVGGLGAQYRAELDALIVYLDATGRDVLLRVGYEFDGPWNCYEQALYVPAFRAVKARIDALGAERIQTVWQSATYPQDGSAARGYDVRSPDHLDGWYPGDDAVDWVAISAFAWDPAHLDGPWSCVSPSVAPSALYDRAARFAVAHDKPLMIAESAPAGYRTANPDGAPDVGCIMGNLGARALTEDALWDAWYAPYFAFAEATPRLEVLAYINSDWEALPQFACAPGAAGGTPSCPNGYWGNSRIQDAASVQDRFAAAMRRLVER